MDDHQNRQPRKYSVAEAKSHFSEILTRVEAGQDVLITRRGLPVARFSAVDRPLQPLRWDAIDAFRNSLAPTTESSEALIRRLRDESY